MSVTLAIYFHSGGNTGQSQAPIKLRTGPDKFTISVMCGHNLYFDEIN